MTESYLVKDTTGMVSAYVGPDATLLASARVLRSSIKLYKASRVIPFRGMTITKMLGAASRITMKPYKRSEIDRAIDDLGIWINNMVLALPTETRA